MAFIVLGRPDRSQTGSHPFLPAPSARPDAWPRTTPTGPLRPGRQTPANDHAQAEPERSARRVALGLIVAGTLVGNAPVDAAPRQIYTNHKPLSGSYPGSYTTRAADPSTPGGALQYSNPQYPNDKPLSGNYPGSYTSSAPTPAQRPGSGFDWLAAGAGAAGMLGLVLLVPAVTVGTRIARNRRHDTPLVLEVRDNTPSVG